MTPDMARLVFEMAAAVLHSVPCSGRVHALAEYPRMYPYTIVMQLRAALLCTAACVRLELRYLER